MKEMASAASSEVIEIYDDCKKEPIFPRTIMCFQIFTVKSLQENPKE